MRRNLILGILKNEFGHGTGGRRRAGAIVVYSCNNLGFEKLNPITLSVLMSLCYLFSVFDSTGSWNDS